MDPATLEEDRLLRQPVERCAFIHCDPRGDGRRRRASRGSVEALRRLGGDDGPAPLGSVEIEGEVITARNAACRVEDHRLGRGTGFGAREAYLETTLLAQLHECRHRASAAET